jgi:hypothetical protein
MTKEALEEAVAEAQRFLRLADNVKWSRQPYLSSGKGHYWQLDASGVATGALRRASMDLTRSLARLRKW